jgi:hypothetical protein
MRFQDWLKRQGEYVSRKKLQRYVKDKQGEIFSTIREELSNEDKNVQWIPTAVYDQDYYKER